MRNGYKIFDSDTHIAPMAETLEPYFDASIRHSVADWEQFKVPFRIGWAGEILQPPYRHRYQFKKRPGWRDELRILGEAGPRETYRISLPKIYGKQVSDAGWLR